MASRQPVNIFVACPARSFAALLLTLGLNDAILPSLAGFLTHDLIDARGRDAKTHGQGVRRHGQGRHELLPQHLTGGGWDASRHACSSSWPLSHIPSLIDIAAMAYSHYQDKDGLVLYGGDDAIIPHPVFPETT